jgi:hypothetical protein
MSEADARAEGRREAAPAALFAVLAFVGFSVVSWTQAWELLGLPWWIWLVVASPALLLSVDLLMAHRGKGLVRSRKAALLLLALLALANLVALSILVADLVTANTADLGGGELLLTAFAIWTTNVVVFGLLFWELEGGGPTARRTTATRAPLDFQFPQDGSERDPKGWRPQVWDYLYVSLTNSLAFSPTDAMPLSVRAKATMGLESGISAVIVLLVAARAVNVLGT